MRKYLYMIGLASLILMNAAVVYAANDVYYVNRENIAMTEDEYNNLISVGFTAKQIERMDYQTFINRKDIHGEIVAQTKQNVKTTVTIRNGIKHYSSQILTDDELISDMSMRDNRPQVNPRTSGNYYDGLSMDDIKILTTTITNIDDYTMQYKLDVDWLTMPSDRSWDIMGIGIESSKVQISLTPTARQDWRYTDGNYGNSQSYLYKEQSTGGSVMIELPSGSINMLESYVFFEVCKQPNVGTITSLLAVGDYAHAFSSVNYLDVYDDYTVNYGLGIEIDEPSDLYYDSIPTADAAFVGTW